MIMKGKTMRKLIGIITLLVVGIVTTLTVTLMKIPYSLVVGFRVTIEKCVDLLNE